MNKRSVEKNISIADEAVNNMLSKQIKDGKLPADSNLRSKMSAFGATVIMSGLLPAIAYYEKNEKDIVDLLWYMYKKEHTLDNVTSLYEYVLKNEKSIGNITEDITNYSIALKLVLNMYIPKK